MISNAKLYELVSQNPQFTAKEKQAIYFLKNDPTTDDILDDSLKKFMVELNEKYGDSGEFNPKDSLSHSQKKVYERKYQENLNLFKKLKEENDAFRLIYLNNIKNNKSFKDPDITFQDLIYKYSLRGYEVPPLSKKVDIFTENPLIMDGFPRIHAFYKELRSKGEFTKKHLNYSQRLSDLSKPTNQKNKDFDFKIYDEIEVKRKAEENLTINHDMINSNKSMRKLIYESFLRGGSTSIDKDAQLNGSAIYSHALTSGLERDKSDRNIGLLANNLGSLNSIDFSPIKQNNLTRNNGHVHFTTKTKGLKLSALNSKSNINNENSFLLNKLLEDESSVIDEKLDKLTRLNTNAINSSSYLHTEDTRCISKVPSKSNIKIKSSRFSKDREKLMKIDLGRINSSRLTIPSGFVSPTARDSEETDIRLPLIKNEPLLSTKNQNRRVSGFSGIRTPMNNAIIKETLKEKDYTHEEKSLTGAETAKFSRPDSIIVRDKDKHKQENFSLEEEVQRFLTEKESETEANVDRRTLEPSYMIKDIRKIKKKITDVMNIEKAYESLTSNVFNVNPYELNPKLLQDVKSVDKQLCELDKKLVIKLGKLKL